MNLLLSYLVRRIPSWGVPTCPIGLLQVRSANLLPSVINSPTGVGSLNIGYQSPLLFQPRISLPRIKQSGAPHAYAHADAGLGRTVGSENQW